jgi:oligopeptide/dipeptide ABC transporter ATP-binding protein
MTMTAPLLEVEDLTIQYETEEGMLTAVSDASFTIEEGEYFGLVGESGSGKSTIGRAIIGGLDENGRIESGTIRYRGDEIQHLSERELNRQIRWKEVSFIPQSSMNSLDPVKRVDDQARAIAAVHDVDEKQAVARFRELCERMGIAAGRLDDYPHQFSGGMQQRVIIALALFLEPSLVIADEPTTALDVIMQDQIFNYLDEIKSALDSSMVLITHDISLVLESCEKMGVMHGGQVAETGLTTELYDDPRHPYTVLLQRAFPDIRYPDRELQEIGGAPPQSMGTVSRCTFVDRCPIAKPECNESAPQLDSIEIHGASTDHRAACFRSNEVPSEMKGVEDEASMIENAEGSDD